MPRQPKGYGVRRGSYGVCPETTTIGSPTDLHGRGSWQHLEYRLYLFVSDF